MEASAGAGAGAGAGGGRRSANDGAVGIGSQGGNVSGNVTGGQGGGGFGGLPGAGSGGGLSFAKEPVGASDAGGSGSGGGSGLLFVKEEVKPISATQTKSLLSSSLANRPRMSSYGGAVGSAPRVPMSPIKIQPSPRTTTTRVRSRSMFVDDETKDSPTAVPVSSPFHGLTPPPSVARAHRERQLSRSMPRSTGDVPAALMSQDAGGFTAAHVIRALIIGCQRKSFRLAKQPHEYNLRISEDGSTTVDFDFPELDGSVDLFSVGVSSFLLTEAANDRVALMIKLPKEMVGLRREQRANLTKIDVTCTPVGGSPFQLTILSSLLPQR